MVFIILVALLSSLVTRSADERVGFTEKLSLGELWGDGIVYDAEGVLVNAEEEARISVPKASSPYNIIVVEGVGISTASLECYYKVEAESGQQTREARNVLVADGLLAYVMYSPIEGSVELLGASGVRINSIEAVRVDGYDIRYEFNIRALIILAVVLILLVAFEKKFGFFFNTGAFVFGIFANVRDTFCARGKALGALHATTLSAMAAYILFSLICFSFGITSLWWLIAILASVGCGGAIAFECLFAKDGPSVSRLFLTLALFIGVFMILTSPPTTQVSWDDGYHFSNSAYVPAIINEWRLPLTVFEYAHECFPAGAYLAHQGDVVGALLASGEKTAVLELGGIGELISAFKWYYVFLIPILPLALVYYAFDYISYIPAIAALSVFCSFGTDFIKVFLVGKLVNLLTYALLVYFGIKRLKSGKYIFSSLALLPLFLFIGGAYSADWWINGAMMLGYAYLIGGMQRDEIFTRRDLFVIIFFMAFACGPKQIYFFLMTPLMFLPKRKFKSKRSMMWTKITVLAVMTAILMTFLVPMILDPGSRTDSRVEGNISSSGQISYILHNPFEYATTLLKFMGMTFSLSSAANNFSLFGWLGYGDTLFALVMVTVLLFCVFTDRSEHDLFRGAGLMRFLNLVATFGTAVLVVTALYVSYTPVGALTVDGCQYRYMFPMFPIVLWCLGSHKVRRGMTDRAMCATVFSMSAFAAVGSFLSVLINIY